MKILLAYSSKTGNTKAVAEAIFSVLPNGTDFLEVGKVKNVDEYDAVIVGFWVDQGLPDKNALAFIETVKNKKTAYFFTLGAYPDSEHAKDCHKNAHSLLAKNDNTVLRGFGCQGKIDPALTEMFKTFPKDHPHYMNEERIKRHKDASSHPDLKDFEEAKAVFKNFAD